MPYVKLPRGGGGAAATPRFDRHLADRAECAAKAGDSRNAGFDSGFETLPVVGSFPETTRILIG